jgi:serine/threonine protein kinase
MFRAPVFEPKSSYICEQFPEGTILPLISKGDVVSGGFSKVSKIHIHPSHQLIIKSVCKLYVRGTKKICTKVAQIGDTLPDLALKEQDPDSEHANEQELQKIYEQESEALTLIAGLMHPNLIQVLSSFEMGKRKCFIFKWAHKGNLRKVWAGREPGAPDINWILWTLDQIWGLSSAIHLLHDLNHLEPGSTDQDRHCRHGDLKPENILCFSEPNSEDSYGNLVIADVGLSKEDFLSTFQRPEHLSETMSGTRRYQPPQVIENSNRSRSYDIWSMGCICLDS